MICTGESYDCYSKDEGPELSFPEVSGETPLPGTHTMALFDMKTVVNASKYGIELQNYLKNLLNWLFVSGSFEEKFIYKHKVLHVFGCCYRIYRKCHFRPCMALISPVLVLVQLNYQTRKCFQIGV